MRTAFRPPFFCLLLSAFAFGAQAQTPTGPEPSALPRPPANAHTLGPVEIEYIEPGGSGVVEDQQGFMWFAGGNDGLARYDGYDIKRFQHDPNDATSLSSDRTETVYVDPEGTLWIGTFGGLNRFEADTETFTHYRHDEDDPTSLSQDTVITILSDHLGTLWVGTHGGLDRFDPETETFTHYRHDEDDPTSLSNDQVRVLYEDRQGTLWVGTGSPSPAETPAGEGGLNRFQPTTGTFIRYLHDPNDETSLIDNQVMSLYEDSRGVFYVGTAGDGLHTMDRTAGTFTRLRADPNDPSKLSRPMLGQVDAGCVGWACGGVTFIHEDSQGLLWVGGFTGGVNRYDPETGAMSHHDATTSGLTDNLIWTMAESSDGTLWLGTWTGMYKVVSSANAFPHYAPDPTDPTSLGGFYIWDVYEDRNGMLWMGTWQNGLDRLDRSTGVFTHFRNDPDDAGSLGSNQVWDLYEDRSGALWVGHGDGGGLSRYDPSSGRFTRFRPDPNDPASLSPYIIASLLEDHLGRFWVGSWGDGLALFDPSTGSGQARETGVAIHHRHDADDPRSLSHNNVSSVYEDEAGTLWIGTQSGLNRLVEGPEAAFETYLPGLFVTSLYQDSRQRFWVGSWGDGLHLLDRETGASTRYGPEQGLAWTNVAGLVEGDDGHLWISTAEGGMANNREGRLSRFDADAETFTNFDTEDGLPEMGFYYDSVLKSRDGTLFFGGAGGFTSFDPTTIREPARRPPKMTLTGLRVFNNKVTPGPEAPLQQPIHRAEEIRLSHAQNDFTLDYMARAYRDLDRIQYQYRLEPYDADWVSARNQRSARYTGLAPGSYVFRVRAVDSRGMRSTEEASIRVVVEPPWWRTVWAYGLYGLVLVGGIVAVDRFQRRRLIARERERARERELEQAREIERSHARLQEAHTELEQAHQHLQTTQAQLVQQEKMASLGQLTAGIAHELKNPLNFINNFAEVNEELARELSQELAAHRDRRVADVLEDLDDLISGLKVNANQITKHGRRADGIVQSMMEHASSESQERFRMEVNAFVDQYITLARQAKSTQLPGFDVRIIRAFDEAAGSVEIAPREMGRVLLNLLSNAFDAVHEKARAVNGDYTPTVTVSTLQRDGQVEIRVSDNGMGVPPSVRDKIFEPFFTTKPTGSGTGLGLSMSYDIVTQGHGGTLSLESTEGEGATFVVTLPRGTAGTSDGTSGVD